MPEKIAIPTEDTRVNAHFGRSQAFTVYEIDEGTVVTEELLDTIGLEHQHAVLAQLLRSKGVNTLICGGIGPGAISGLENAGIKVLRGAQGQVRDVAQTYAEGRFVSTNAVCSHKHDHHDHGLGHHHHGHDHTHSHKHYHNTVTHISRDSDSN